MEMKPFSMYKMYHKTTPTLYLILKYSLHDTVVYIQKSRTLY